MSIGSTILGINLMPIGQIVDWLKYDETGDYKSADVADNLIFAQFVITMTEFSILFILCSWHLWVAARLKIGWASIGWLLILALNLLNFTLVWIPLLGLIYDGYVAISIIMALIPWVTLFLLWIFRPQYFYTIGEYRRRRMQQRLGG